MIEHDQPVFNQAFDFPELEYAMSVLALPPRPHTTEIHRLV